MKRMVCVVLAVLLLTGCATAQVPEVTEVTEWTMPSSPYMPEDFRQDGEFLSCVAGNAVIGIDVSSHQGQIDWQAVAAAGVEFAFVRLGYRGYEYGNLNADSCAVENLRRAREAGILVGAYFFSQAISVEEAKEEARFALEVLDGIHLNLPLVYDWEYISESARTANVGRELLTDCTLAFCKIVEKAGYDAMIYFNASQGKRLLDLQKLEMYPWWLAKYDLDTDFLCRVDLWQYTNTGSVPGIKGDVDINLMFTDFGLGQAVFGEVE